ncbi:MAG TPA: endonuclease/exonuclease/phosphatase family protein [Anaerolineae bacterium]|nr:endonuclease/exonuclease/phosphatase family protein [Anaerolineae bacterium]
MTLLRVLAYNLCFGGTDRVDAILAVLRHVDADVVALTEADDPRVVATLAEQLGLYHVWQKGSGDRHIATLSRFPIVESRIYNTPPLTQAVLETRLELPHPPTPSPETGNFVSGDANAGRGGEAITVYNVHLLPYLLLPYEIRRWQAVGKLLGVIRSRRPGAHLILGDLNTIAPHDRVLQQDNPPRMRRMMALQLNLVFRLAVPRLLRAGYVDCFRRLHPAEREDGFTWRPGNRTTRYDYILADPVMAPALSGCCVVDDIEAVNVASDHFPLLAEFDLRAVKRNA